MKNYEVSITTEITYTVTIPAENEDDAYKIARYDRVGPCTVKLDGSDEIYEGIIKDVWEGTDVVIENPDDADEEEE